MPVNYVPMFCTGDELMINSEFDLFISLLFGALKGLSCFVIGEFVNSVRLRWLILFVWIMLLTFLEI